MRTDEDLLFKRESITGVTVAEVAAMLAGYLARRRAAYEVPPYVCPGCHAVAPERCVPGCFDDEIEAEHRHAIESGDYDDELEEADQ